MIARRERRQILERVNEIKKRHACVAVGTLDENTVELWFQTQTGDVVRKRIFRAYNKAVAWLKSLDGVIVGMIDGGYGRVNEDRLMRKLIQAKML